MEKNEYIYKYCELIEQANEKEAKLESYVQEWLSNESVLSSNTMEQTIISINDQIAQMRMEAEKYKKEFERLSKEEQLKQEQLESSKAIKMRLKQQLGIDTSQIVITDGILSANANESHLVGREKTKEELEIDKQIAISTLREKVVKKEITLAQASKLKNDINSYYGTSENVSSKLK